MARVARYSEQRTHSCTRTDLSAPVVAANVAPGALCMPINSTTKVQQWPLKHQLSHVRAMVQYDLAARQLIAMERVRVK